MSTKIICNNCQGYSIVNIDEPNKVISWKQIDKVISARYRFDGQWGFQCYCGNNSIMSKQEIESISNPQLPTIKEIEDIKNNLVMIPDTKFSMEYI